MFVIEGLPAIGWAFIFRAIVADRPADAEWLGAKERDELERALEAEQQDLPEERGFREVARSWNAIVLSAQYLLWSIGVYGLVFWLPSIIKHLTGRGIGSTGLLTAIPYAAAVLAMLACSTASDRTARRRVFTWVPLVVAAACFGASYGFHGLGVTVSFVLLIVAAAGMYAPYGPYFAHIPELFPTADAAPATGMINAFGGLGGFVGTYIVGALGGADSPVPFVFLAACLAAAAALMFLVRRPEPARDSARVTPSRARRHAHPPQPA
jgi:nitrate/nitrite transporter NarK